MRLLMKAFLGCSMGVGLSLGAQEMNVISPLRVDGANFEIKTLGSKKRAYGNRHYVWLDVPEQLEDWDYTQTYGGRMAVIRFAAPRDGHVMLATAEKYRHILGPDWERVPDCEFRYTDGGRTLMGLYRRLCREGEAVQIPQRYWSLVNKQSNPRALRNVLALVSSDDLTNWRTDSVLLMHPDPGNHAFQYVDWVFEGDDMIVVSRTAWGNSHNIHDANYMTFHRVTAFRAPGRDMK